MVAPTGIVVKNVAGFSGAALRATDGRPYVLTEKRRGGAREVAIGSAFTRAAQRTIYRQVSWQGV